MNLFHSSLRGICVGGLLVVAVLLGPVSHASTRGEMPAIAPPGVQIKDKAAAVELGRMLFFDPKLSADKWVSCGSCHQPGLALSDGRAHASGVRGRKGVRNTPSLLDVGQQRSMFWDGRRASLEDQALDPLLNSAEHGLRDTAEVLEKLHADPRYPEAFQAAFGVPMEQVGAPHLTKALATYQRTLVSGPNPFDRFLAGQTDALPPAALRGWRVFDNQARCTRCHAVESMRPLLTDHRFHSRPDVVRRLGSRLPALKWRVSELHRQGRVYDEATLSNASFAELGRYLFTRDPEDVGSFKTPGLRNVALTAPYMHDGSVPTLAAAVDVELQYRGKRGQSIVLSAAQREDLLAFLQALTGQSAAEEPEPDGPLPVPPAASAPPPVAAATAVRRRSGPAAP
jgi:cytochrome c peroxidase